MKNKGGRPTPEEAAALHRRIIVAATAEFMARGYVKSSMDRIASESRTTKQSIYRAYPSKEALFKAVIGDAIRQRSEEAPDFIDDPRPPVDVLKAVAVQMRRSAASGLIGGMRNAIMDVRETFPQLHAEALAFINQSSIATRLGDYFQALTSKGLLDMKRPYTAAVDFALLVSTEPQLLGTAAVDFSTEDRVEEVVHFFLRGYAPDKG